jgi:hypothetical protein
MCFIGVYHWLQQCQIDYWMDFNRNRWRDGRQASLLDS